MPKQAKYILPTFLEGMVVNAGGYVGMGIFLLFVSLICISIASPFAPFYVLGGGAFVMSGVFLGTGIYFYSIRKKVKYQAEWKSIDEM